MLVVDVDDHFLDRLELLAVLLADDDARPTDGQLETLAAHVFDQHGQLEFATAGDFEAVGLAAFGDADGDIALGFTQQAIADDTALHLVALAAGERAVIDAEGDRQGRRVDRLGRQRLVDARNGQRVGDSGLLKAGNGDDVAGFGDVDGGALEAAEGENLGDAALFEFLAVAGERMDGVTGFDLARKDTPGQQAAEERVALDGGHEHAERPLFHLRLGDVFDDLVEQRPQRFLGTGRVGAHPALLGRTVENREVELLGRRFEGDEQIEDLLEHFEMALVGPVDLVDRHDRPQALGKGLRQHELGLRHRAFGGVDEDHHAVHHRQDALHLATKIGVAGGVDDIDARVLPDQRGHLGEDGDAALALEIIGVHRALFDALIVAERTGLPEQNVDESGLAMVDMGDDRDVAQRHWGRLRKRGELRGSIGEWCHNLKTIRRMGGLRRPRG